MLGSQPVGPVKVDRFENLLVGYSPALKTLLVDGFRNGFRIYYIDELSSFESSNLRSALHSPDIVSAKLKKEIVAERVVGPFKAPPFPNFRTLPIGIVPKKTPNDFRFTIYRTIEVRLQLISFLGSVHQSIMLLLMMPFIF